MKKNMVSLLAALLLFLVALPSWAAGLEDCKAAARLSKSGSFQEALKLYGPCLRSRKLNKRDRSVAYNNRGNTYYGLGDNARALRDYNKAIKLEPGNPLAHMNRGLVWNSKGRPDKAMADFSKAIELRPRFATAYYNRGITRVMKQRGWSTEAERDFILALSLDATYVGKFYRVGTKLQKDGFVKGLVEKFADRVLRPSAMAQKQTTEGMKLQEQKRYADAILLFNKALEMFPFEALIYYRRGKSYYFLKDYEQALLNFKQAIKNKPKYSIVYIYRGKVYYRQGDYRRALQQINIALRHNSKRAYAYYTRSQVYEKMGQREKAIADVKKFMELKPDSPHGPKRLAKLQGK